MPLLNEYIDLCGPATFGALGEDSGCNACPVAPPLSQIVKVFAAPHGAYVPTDWEDQAGFFSRIDNADIADAYIKAIVGRGSLQIQDIGTTAGRTYQMICRRVYTLEHVLPVSQLVYDFSRVLERNWTGFRIWYLTLGGYLYGGQNGIQVHFTGATLAKEAEDDSHEESVLRFVWYADGSPDRAYVPELLNNEAAV